MKIDEDLIDADADGGAEDLETSPRPASSSHVQELTSPVFSDATDAMRRQSEAEQIFDPQLQTMDTNGSMSQHGYAQLYVVIDSQSHVAGHILTYVIA